jgi:hypothetical protein
MEQFWDEIDGEEVHIRDMWQFELKSEFFPHLNVEKNRYVQEFFFFVPNSLQINRFTYSKEQFYEDQTNLIRYKTPEFSLAAILDLANRKSPLARISTICKLPNTLDNQDALEDELKLLANIVRSSLRNQTRRLIYELNRKMITQTPEPFLKEIEYLIQQLRHLKNELRTFNKMCKDNWHSGLFEKYFSYVEEFINNAIYHYLSGLLEVIRSKTSLSSQAVDQLICDFLLETQSIKDKKHLDTLIEEPEKIPSEQMIYRKSILNKFILDALLLNTNRISLDVKYRSWIGGLAAGIAMLVYILFFIWLGSVFIINSQPFLLLTVIVYILKDRIKDEIKSFSFKHAFKWFSDYTTEIRSPNLKQKLGVIRESFSFLDEAALAEEILHKRTKEFHTVLEEVQRPESVLCYKRTVLIEKPTKGREGRRHGLNIIFRFNIHRFLLKASDPYEPYAVINPETRQLVNLLLPKVYHLNLIIKSTSLKEDGTENIEFKKLRLIIDKNGIKRIEQLR